MRASKQPGCEKTSINLAAVLFALGQSASIAEAYRCNARCNARSGQAKARPAEQPSFFAGAMHLERKAERNEPYMLTSFRNLVDVGSRFVSDCISAATRSRIMLTA